MIRIYGDIMLDRWIYGETNRLSPEAPVPVLLQKNVKENVGGAGNVAMNLHSLNTPIHLYGTIGKDESGKIIQRILSAHDILYTLDTSPITTTKTRLLSNNHHIARYDQECFYHGSLLHSIMDDIQLDDIVLVSDYAKGCVGDDCVKHILTKTPYVLVDPKLDAERYRNAWLVKPNKVEFEKWAGTFTENKAFVLLKQYGWTWLVVTLGKDGIFVINKDGKSMHFKEEVHDVVDVSGAGDTVFATLAHCINNDMDVFRAAEYACRAASRVVERSGVSLVTHKDFVKDVVFTNGCFDILHKGHYQLFNECQSFGKKIVIGINSDDSVKRLKGSSRPINDEITRKNNLLALGIFHDVIIFNEDTPYKLIQQLKPDIIIKGGDYTIDQIIGRDISIPYIVNYLDGYSTTKIIENMK